jgi:hypothetical protein
MYTVSFANGKYITILMGEPGRLEHSVQLGVHDVRIAQFNEDIFTVSIFRIAFCSFITPTNLGYRRVTMVGQGIHVCPLLAFS